MTMQPWFTEAKLGIFVHYGIYSVEGVPESWALFDHVVPHEQYMRQLDRFTASAFDASAWAGLFARAGAGYAASPPRRAPRTRARGTATSPIGTARYTSCSARSAERSHSPSNRADPARTGPEQDR